MIKFRNTVAGLLLGAAFALSGCAGFAGKLAVPASDFPTVHDLILAHENYRVYFAGTSVHLPAALAFDPEWDDLELQFHPHWSQVRNPDLMREIVKWLELDPHYRPYLYDIIGREDGRFYGYIYTVQTHVSIAAPEPGILRVGSMHPTGWETRNGRGFLRR